MTAGVCVLALLTTGVGFIESPIGDGWLGRWLGRPAKVGTGADLLLHLSLVALGWLAAAGLYRWRWLDQAPMPRALAAARAVLASGFGTERLAERIASAADRLVSACAVMERAAMDRTPLALGRSVQRIAIAAAGVERTVVDASASALADLTLHATRMSGLTDRRVLDRGIEHAASGIGRFGNAVRPLQSGKVYHYLAPVFVWVLLVALAIIVVRISGRVPL